MGRPKKIPKDHPFHQWFPEIHSLVPPEKFAPESNLAKVLISEGIESTPEEYVKHILTFVLRRLKPETPDIIGLFTHTTRCLDVGCVVEGSYNADNGYWMVSHPDPDKRNKKKSAKLTLHKELQRIFCLPGNEAKAKGKVLRHVMRKTKSERAHEGCSCANWTHTVEGTKKENALDFMRSEGGTSICGFQPGEDNKPNNNSNDNVNRLRIETWILSIRAAGDKMKPEERRRLGFSTVLERQDWAKDDPRWRFFKHWRYENGVYMYQKAEEFGVHIKTIRRYLNYETYKSVVRCREPVPYSVAYDTRRAQRALHHHEILLGKALLTDVPVRFRKPLFTASAERTIGRPEQLADGSYKNGLNFQVGQVIFRTLRRLLNQDPRHSYPPPYESRDHWVRRDNLPELKDTLKQHYWTVSQRVCKWVTEMKADEERQKEESRSAMAIEDDLATRSAPSTPRPTKRAQQHQTQREQLHSKRVRLRAERAARWV